MALPQGPYCHSTRTTSSASCSTSDPLYQPRPSSSTTTLDHSFFYLPPAGLGLQLKGSNPNSLFDCRDDFESGPTSSHSASRKLSSSSSHSTASSSANPSESTAPSSSSSFFDETKTVGRRKQWVREALGEDPALAAARHALWEDLPIALDPSTAPSAAVLPATKEDAPVAEDDGEDEDDEDDVPPADLPPLPSPSRPSHATLPPLPSCLRPPSRPPSPTSSHSSSRHSVQFSPDPPESAATYSPVDYERGGEQQVEKLSMREFIELRDVRTAIGLWSGKIKSGEDGVEVKEEIEVVETTGITMHMQRPGVRTLSQGRSAWPL